MRAHLYFSGKQKRAKGSYVGVRESDSKEVEYTEWRDLSDNGPKDKTEYDTIYVGIGQTEKEADGTKI